MAKLPKSLIKKYGISKKAWQVFRGQKQTSSRSKKTRKTKVYTMAKKKYFSGKKGKGFLNKAFNILIGAGVAALYEVYISPKITFIGRTMKNIIELVVGLALALMPKLPMAIRAGGAALATINAFEIIVPLISNFSSGTKSTSSMLNM